MRPSRSRRPDPPATHGEVAGIHFEWVLETPLVRLSRWRCLEREAGLTGERRQHWRVFGFVHEGSFAVRTPRGGGLVDSLHAVILNQDEPYTTSHPCGVGDRGSGLVLRRDLFDEMLARRHPRAAEDGRRLRPTAPCPATALARHRRVLRAAESAAGIDPLAAEEAALAVAEEILGAAGGRDGSGAGSGGGPHGAGHDTGPPAARHRDLAEGVKAFLGREFRSPLRLDAIAAAVGSTPAHLGRVFRRITGTSIHAYLTRLRLRAALEPVMAGAGDLSGLAHDLGFSSHSHFTYAFRREFGCPPSRLRGAGSGISRARF